MRLVDRKTGKKYAVGAKMRNTIAITFLMKTFRISKNHAKEMLHVRLPNDLSWARKFKDDALFVKYLEALTQLANRRSEWRLVPITK